MPEQFSSIERREPRIDVWTGDEIQKWFHDIHIGDKIVSKSGTEREVILVDGGPYVYCSTRKYDQKLEQYHEPEFEKLLISKLRARAEAIRFVERKFFSRR